MIEAWRITKLRHAASAFSGEGARLYGGRWNSAGLAVVYVSASQSLAMLEIVAHLNRQSILDRYVVFQVEFDESMVEVVDPTTLGPSWRDSPRPVEIAAIGDEWVRRGTSAVLAVPSTLIPAERNYLLNTAHPEFSAIAIGPPTTIEIDPRLR